MHDLRTVFRFFAKEGDPQAASYKPSCLEPLRGGNQLCLDPKADVELFGRFFAGEMARGENGQALLSGITKKRKLTRSARESIALEDPISGREALLAVRDPPEHTAPGPDQVPNEIYAGFPSIYGKTAELFTEMLN